MRAANQRLGNCSIFDFVGNSSSKPGASTPTMVGAGPKAADTGRDLPITDRSPPKRRWKYSLLRIAIVGCGGGAGGAPPAGGGGWGGVAGPSDSSKYPSPPIGPPIIFKKIS